MVRVPVRGRFQVPAVQKGSRRNRPPSCPTNPAGRPRADAQIPIRKRPLSENSFLRSQRVAEPASSRCRLVVHAGVMGGNRGALRAGQHVLVTGHRALVGRAVVDALRDAGLIVVGLDLADGDDITEPATVRERIQGCVGVVHLAAADDEPDKPDPLTPATVGGWTR